MRMRSWLAFVGLAVSCAAHSAPSRPRLVVVFSVDQFRADYVRRFESHFLPAKQGSKLGGLQWLKQQGAYFTDAEYAHVPTSTGPGHASILTGSVPAFTGIVENDWFSKETGKMRYCVEDPTVETVGGGKTGPMSPKSLLVTTVGDELKMATNGKSKVVGVAIKDRGSILLAGHAADTVIWFDGTEGIWVTSSFYAPDKKLPDWVSKINADKRPEKELANTWTPLLPDAAYGYTRPAPFVKDPLASPVFSHSLAGTGAGRFGKWINSGYSQEYIFDTLVKAVDAEQLGQDETPDMLVVNLATNDYIGHAYGPNSPEVMDITVRTDRLLSAFFNTLNKKIPGGMANVTVVLTADHGVLPIVEEQRDVYRIGAMRIPGADLNTAVNKALSEKYGAGTWVQAFSSPHLYISDALIKGKGLNAAEVHKAAAEAVEGVKGIYRAVTRQQVLEGRLPLTDWSKLITNGYMPSRGGDVLVLENPGNYFGAGNGTGHGSPWTYDRHIPILFGGYGVTKGTFGRKVYIPDIAPTLSYILGIEKPSGNIGTLLKEALGQ